MATHNETGSKGEKLAQEYLIANGYSILATNYRYLKAEIDIIGLKKDTLAIVEVKTRSSTDFGAPESFVNKKKIKLILDATNAYIEQHHLDYNVSFDIISVIWGTEPTVEHIENAYYYF